MHFRQTFSLLFFLSHKILSHIFPQTLCLSHQLITQKEYNSFALVLSLSLSHSPKRLSVPLHVRTIWLPSSTYTHSLSLFCPQLWPLSGSFPPAEALWLFCHPVIDRHRLNGWGIHSKERQNWGKFSVSVYAERGIIRGQMKWNFYFAGISASGIAGKLLLAPWQIGNSANSFGKSANRFITINHFCIGSLMPQIVSINDFKAINFFFASFFRDTVKGSCCCLSIRWRGFDCDMGIHTLGLDLHCFSFNWRTCLIRTCCNYNVPTRPCSEF